MAHTQVRMIMYVYTWSHSVDSGSRKTRNIAHTYTLPLNCIHQGRDIWLLLLTGQVHQRLATRNYFEMGEGFDKHSVLDLCKIRLQI